MPTNCPTSANYITRSLATAETVHDVETAIQGHSRSSIVASIYAAYMTSC